MSDDILAFGRATMATSASGIPTPFDQLNQAGTIQSTYASVEYVVQIPTFGGITGLTQQANGSLRASWSAGSTPLTPLVYDIYIQPATATGLFNSANRVRSTFGLTIDLFTLTDGTLLALGTTYHVGVRARDPYGNVSTTTASLSAASLGVQPSRVLAPGDIPAIVAAVWDELQAGHTTPGTFGKFLDAEVSPKAAQATADTINNKIGNPVGSSISADIANVQSGVNLTNTKIGVPVGANVTADIAAVKAEADTLVSRLTAPRAANLDNLDIAVSTRESESAAASRAAADLAASAGVLAAVQSIQNNTTFVGIVPPALVLPPSGSLDYKFFANLYDTSGSPKDPDGNTMSFRIDTTAGVEHVPTTAMTRTAVGAFEATHNAVFNDVELELIVSFIYTDDTVPFTQRRLTRQTQDNNQLDTLLSRLTEQRAENLDNLDVPVSSRVSDANDLTRYSNLLVEHSDTQAAVAAVSSKIGTPVMGSVVNDITAVRVQTDKIGSPANTTLAADLVAVQTKLGTPAGASMSDDIAAVKAVADTVNTKTGTPVVSVAADVAAVKAVADTVNAKIGTPVGTVSADVAAVKAVADTVNTKVGTPAGASLSADVAAVKADTGGLRADYTTTRAAKLDFLDASVATRALESTVQAIKAKTDTMPEDFADLARAQHINRMTTALNNLTGVQEVLVWAEKDGQIVTSSSNCSIAVKDDLGATIWSGFAVTPSADGIFLFSNSFAPLADGNYYVTISIIVDGTMRSNKQPFVAVG